MSAELLKMKEPVFSKSPSLVQRKQRFIFGVIAAVVLTFVIVTHHAMLERAVETQLHNLNKLKLDFANLSAMHAEAPAVTMGQQGEQGPPGRPGIPGPVGPKGDQGARGPEGPQGNTGPEGPKGDAGQQGPTGDAGLRGPKGDTGLRGPKGDTGLRGPKGDTGLRGPKGDTGLRGPKGETGLRGPPRETCGGLITVLGSRNLTYEAPPTGLLQGCAWVISSRTNGSISVRLVQDDTLEFSSSFTLRVMYQPNSTNSHHQKVEPNSEYQYNVQFIYLFFYGTSSARGQGFHLNIQANGTRDTSKHVAFIRRDESFTYKYPAPPSIRYNHNQAFFILGAPPQGMRANINVTGIDTELQHDWVSILYVNPTATNHGVDYRRSGPGAQSMEISYIPENMPFILVFSSDSSVDGRGFFIDAKYY